MPTKNTFRFKGIWHCYAMRTKHQPISCGRVNLYVSKHRQFKPHVIDAVCRRCNSRVKFQPTRRDRRGGIRKVGFSWIDGGHAMTIEEAFEILEAAQRNRDMIHKRFIAEGFTRASEIDDSNGG